MLQVKKEAIKKLLENTMGLSEVTSHKIDLANTSEEIDNILADEMFDYSNRLYQQLKKIDQSKLSNEDLELLQRVIAQCEGKNIK